MCWGSSPWGGWVVMKYSVASMTRPAQTVMNDNTSGRVPCVRKLTAGRRDLSMDADGGGSRHRKAPIVGNSSRPGGRRWHFKSATKTKQRGLPNGDAVKP